MALLAIVLLLSDAIAAESPPHWIWGRGRETTGASLRIVRSFQTTSPTTAAQLRFVPVSARLTLRIDGQVVASAEPYDVIQTLELASRLTGGTHELVVEAIDVAGPSSFFLELNLIFEDATCASIVSDSQWSVAGGEAAEDLGPIDRGLMVPEDRRVGIDVVDDYEQWKQALDANQGTDPASFLVAPDFEIQRIRSAMPDEDSWVSLAFDPQGRAIIAKEKRGLLRMTLSNDGSEVTHVEVVDDALEECRGLAFIGDDLYANANNSKGLFRLRAEDGRFGVPQLLFALRGDVGHGRNDLAVGPDGKLYSIHGDSVDLPDDCVDCTSPLRDTRRDQRVGEGHLLRMDPDSAGQVEVLAAGLRNPFGIDFNADGEAFTYDADAEYDMGSPWYRPTRVNHLVIGGDYGWRAVTKSWPPYYPDHPDNARPNLDIGKGSPTAVKFGAGSNFPARYRDALFILDWAYGRILAVHMIPRGGSYLMTAETFLKGRPLNVTDLDFGPKGSMYFVTGGRQTQSALYRVSYLGHAAVDSNAEITTPHQTDRNEFAKHARRVRRALEADLLQAPTQERLANAWLHLSDPDPWIRHAAVNVIERHPIVMWQARALAESDVTSAVQALTSLARSGQPDVYPAVLHRLNEILPDVKLPSDTLSALYVYWLCLQEPQDLDEVLRLATMARLNAQYPSDSFPNAAYAQNRLLSETLTKLGARDVVAKTIRLLNTAANQTEQMHYLYVLRNVSQGWTTNDRRAYFSGLAQTEHYLGGQGMGDFLNKIREEAVATLTNDERQQLGDLITGAPTREEVVDTTPRPFVRKWTVDELLSSASLENNRDLARGAEMFREARCIQCHRFGTRGTLIGPDLTSVARRFSRRDLLASILEPSKVIAENYRSLQVVTSDGKSYVGQATLGGDYRSPILHLAADPMQPFATVDIAKVDIESQQFSDVSWMPTGLLDTFTQADVMDLIGYLETQP